MLLKFYGAAHEVTGSMFHLCACGKNILVDCGMEQGTDQYENQELSVSASEIDYVLLTHAHIDHSGNLPLLFKRGFKGNVYSTRATHELCGIMLRDSAHIQMFEAEWKNRKAKRSGAEPFVPLYEMSDAEGVLKLFEPYEYGEIIEIAEGIKLRFTDAGHLLGSASIELWLTENGITKKIVFSGDIGNLNQPLIHDPQYIDEADYVVMESTYGDRLHGKRPDYLSELSDIIRRTFDNGGNLIIPSFAVGRTQEILYYLRAIKEAGMVRGHESFPVYVDSPLAIEATNIFNENTRGYFDDEAMSLIERGINPISFPGLATAVTSEESKRINSIPGSKIIISASGMCDAGRVRHHLKHNLWRPDSTVLFVGYQANGTLGRMLLDGVKNVRLFGEEITVRANILRLEGVSAHADKDGLIHWVESFKRRPDRIFIVHGQDTVCDSFAELLRSEYGHNTSAPYSGEIFDLAANMLVMRGEIIPAKKKSELQKRKDTVFERLLAAGNRLIGVIRKNEGGPNKDLARFKSQIDSLCDKWDR